MSRAPKVPAKIRRKAEAVREALARPGARLADVRARKLRWDSKGEHYSVELGRRWRVIVRKTEDGFEIGEAMSHETYSRTHPR